MSAINIFSMYLEKINYRHQLHFHKLYVNNTELMNELRDTIFSVRLMKMILVQVIIVQKL